MEESICDVCLGTAVLYCEQCNNFYWKDCNMPEDTPGFLAREYRVEVKWMVVLGVTISQVYHYCALGTDTIRSYRYKIPVVPAVGIELPEIVSRVINVEFWHNVSVIRVSTVSYTLIHVGCMYVGCDILATIHVHLSKKYQCLMYVDFITNVSSRVL